MCDARGAAWGVRLNRRSKLWRFVSCDTHAHFNITLSCPQLNAVDEEVNKHRQGVKSNMEKQSGASGRG